MKPRVPILLVIVAAASLASACRSKSDDAPTARKQIPYTCGACHAGILVTYLEGVHGADFKAGVKDVPVCTDCHTTNAQTITYKSPAYAPNCAGCHASQFSAEAHPKYTSPSRVNYTVSELRDCAGSCHIYTDSSMTTVKTYRNSHHRSSSGSFD